MGVPLIYRWFLNRYPNVVVNAKERKVGDDDSSSSEPNPNGIEFDNLYLDMNGIIHPCFHPDDHDHLLPPTTFDEVFKTIFQYIDRLFRIVRPRKLLYLAIDGVAPRAKMNQQRSRRFRNAKDAEIAESEEQRLRKEFEMEGKKVGSKHEYETSDSNVITPGTEFMDKLSKALQYYIRLRLSSDPGWKKIKVILSDANVPGEGEHKIMKFIRLQRNLPGYDPNTVHCLYGLDADLIMLALATHEPHFALLREDVLTQLHQPSCSLSPQSSQSKTEFNSVKSRGWFNRVHEKHGGVSLAKKPYQFLNIWTLREYLELDMKISDPPFVINLERIIDDFIFMCFFTGNDFLPHMPSLQINEGAIDLLLAVYRDGFNSRGGYLVDMQRVDDQKSFYVKLKTVEKFILSVGTYEEKIFKKRSDLQERKLRSLLRTNANEVADQATEDFPFNEALGNLQLDRKKEVSLELEKNPSAYNTSTSSKEETVLENTKEFRQKVKDVMRDKSDLFKQGGFERDKVRLGMLGWRERYYKEKFSVESPKDIESIRKVVVEKYTEGLCWVLHYYFSGVPSWTWYYPFHYGPFASDLKGLGRINIKFKLGAPFKPFDQLMGVLPPRSVTALPKAYWNLMTSEESNLIDFYPTELEVDTDGKRYLWQGIIKLPFIEEERLLIETKKLENELKGHEVRRNSERMDVMFMNRSHDLGSKILSNKSSAGRVSIDVNASGGMNGFILPCDEDLSTSVFNVKELEDFSEDEVVYVLYELPDTHPHIPRLAEKVELPGKTITEDGIVKTPLWHEYEGWTPPPNRLHIQQKYRQVKNVASPESAKVIQKGAGSGFSAGRGKGIPTTSNLVPNIQPSTGIGGAKSGKAFTEQVSSSRSTNSYIQAVTGSKVNSTGPSSVGQRWTGDVSNQAIWRGNRSSGISNSGQGSGSNGGRGVGNSSFWPSRNVSTDGQSSKPQYVSVSAGRGRGRGRFERLNTDTERSSRW